MRRLDTCEADGCPWMVCYPDCAGQECGDDGCGGICGVCGPGAICGNGACECDVPGAD